MKLTTHEKQTMIKLICAQQERMIKYNPLLFIAEEYTELERLKIKIKRSAKNDINQQSKRQSNICVPGEY